MATDLFSSLHANIDGKLDLFLNERLQNVVDVVRGPLALGLVIYIALFGYMVMRGIISEPWGELFYRMVKLCLLYIAATTVAYRSDESGVGKEVVGRCRSRWSPDT